MMFKDTELLEFSKTVNTLIFVTYFASRLISLHFMFNKLSSPLYLCANIIFILPSGGFYLTIWWTMNDLLGQVGKTDF